MHRDLKIRPIITGLLSRIPGLFDWWDKRRPMGNTVSAEYCRSIWRLHLSHFQKATGISIPSSIGELGPGATLGVCISALLDGVRRAHAFDAGFYASIDKNRRIFEELALSSMEQTNIDLLRSALTATANDNRELILQYTAPWDDKSVCGASTLDFIFSQSVMQHVNNPASVYDACHHWLKPNGIMSHRIDHSSHGITQSWNGHYFISNFLWGIIFGRRPYLLNRKTPREHIDQIVARGFEILPETQFLVITQDGLKKKLPTLPSNVYLVRTSTIVARKIGD